MSEKSNQGNSGGNMSEILFFLLLSLFENSYNKNLKTIDRKSVV